MRICVFGLGKVGLPLAVQFASKGHYVTGVDVSAHTIELVNSGVPPFPGEAGLQPLLRAVATGGLLTARPDGEAAVAEAEAVIVVVPLAVDDGPAPDFTQVDAATRVIGRGLRRGTLVSYETTVPVGTTRGRFAPALSAVSGLTVGRDFSLVFSPERVMAGRVLSDLRSYPKLLGGIDAVSAEDGLRFYASVLDFDPRPDLGRPNGVWDLGSAEAAELAKLAETAYRDVNIALANTFARHADRLGVDAGAVIEACNSQPFSHIHQPGVAVGGHCIPVYPYFYLSTDPNAAIIRVAREVNDAMPEYTIGLLSSAMPLVGARVAVLGVAYRGGVKECAFSGVFGVVDALRMAGAVPVVADPLYSDREIRDLGLVPHAWGNPVDAAVIQADHAEYRALTSAALPGIRVLVDGRGITEPSAWPRVRRIVIGRTGG